MFSVKFVSDPPYSVDFRKFRKEIQTVPLDTKIISIARRCLKQIEYFSKALASASYLTVSNMGVSFKHIVLNYYGSSDNFIFSSDIYFLVVKVCFWLLAVGWCTAATTARLYLEKNQVGFTPGGIDRRIASGVHAGIDPAHIKTSKLTLNAADVPKEVKVDDLVQVYDAINFSNRGELGYMSPSSRKEGTNTYEVQELRESLQTFIQKVKKREAFLGTPPAWDTPRLMAFYQQIEDAVRLSLHKANSDIEEFLGRNGRDVGEYDPSQKVEYANLLENKARIAIDLAIAGKHCGARYMGEAMSTYYLICGNKISGDLNLQDAMIEILAQKRKEIAEKQIQQHLGNDTHAYAAYMNSLGALLQLPGTENIVEHLRSGLDRAKLLRLFFEEYSVDCIIKAIQEEIKNEKGNSFRTKIIEWIKDQVEDWKIDEYEKTATEIATEVEKIIKEQPSASSNRFESLQHVQDLLTFVGEKKTALFQITKWDEFLEELFLLDCAKEWRKGRFPDLSRIELMRQTNMLRINLSESHLGTDTALLLLNEIKGKGNFQLEEFREKLDEIEKIDKIRAVIPMEKGSIERALRGDVKIKYLIDSQMDIQRRNEFLAQFRLENMAKEGISPELMEWLLVSHSILLTQV